MPQRLRLVATSYNRNHSGTIYTLQTPQKFNFVLLIEKLTGDEHQLIAQKVLHLLKCVEILHNTSFSVCSKA
jgi:hypothetical protein